MRFFTVPDAKSSRISAFYATTFIGYFYILTFIIGFGAIIFLTNNYNYIDLDNNLDIGQNVDMEGLYINYDTDIGYATDIDCTIDKRP